MYNSEQQQQQQQQRGGKQKEQKYRARAMIMTDSAITPPGFTTTLFG